MRAIDPTYGSDEHGLVWGYHFVPSQPADPLTSQVAAEFLSEPNSIPQGEFLWLHFSLASVASESWLRNLNLPDAFYESLS